MKTESVRKVVKRTGRCSMRGYFQSRKMNRAIECESKLEMDAAIYFETMPWVIRYCEQPVRVDFYMEGKMHRYVPDFELFIRDQHRPVHAEIKTQQQLRKQEIQNRLDHIASHYEQHMDCDFIVLTEAELHNEPQLSNMRTLQYYSSRGINPDELQEAADKLNILPPKTVAAAQAVLGDKHTIYRLLSAGVYTFNMIEPLGPDTAIYPVEIGGCHAQV